MTMIIKEREEIHERRVASERNGLLYDIAIWKAVPTSGSILQHHVNQFEQLCLGMFDRLGTLYQPEDWPNLDRSTLDSLIVSVLSGKWVLLRQVALQRAPGNPYLDTLKDLDDDAEDGYDRLRQALENVCGLKGLSSSPPLVYLGPIARVLLFDEEAPCLISTPFGAANGADPSGQELCRQTIPHEVAHAIFDQIPGLLDELKLRAGLGLAKGGPSSKERATHPVLLNWLDEMIADMAGTALAGLDFARSAAVITIMPDKAVGITDDNHPIPLLRPFIHAHTLRKVSPQAPSEIDDLLAEITRPYLNKRFESLPTVSSVTMEEVRTQMIRLVDIIWDTRLDTLGGHSLGEVLTDAAGRDILKRGPQELPAWGKLSRDTSDLVFRLVGTNDPVSPLPRSRLYLDVICCPLKWPACCSQKVI